MLSPLQYQLCGVYSSTSVISVFLLNMLQTSYPTAPYILLSRLLPTTAKVSIYPILVFSNYFYLCIDTEKRFLAQLSLHGLMHKSKQGIAADYMVNIVLVVFPSKKCCGIIFSVKWN